MISFFVAGVPLPAGSGDRMRLPLKCSCGRVHKSGRPGGYVDNSDKPTKSRKSGALKRWKATIAGEARFTLWESGGAELAGPVRVKLELWVKPVKVKGRVWPQVKPDIDKLCRAVLDGLTGVTYADDGQVCQLEAVKRYASLEHPATGVLVTIGPIELE